MELEVCHCQRWLGSRVVVVANCRNEKPKLDLFRGRQAEHGSNQLKDCEKIEEVEREKCSGVLILSAIGASAPSLRRHFLPFPHTRLADTAEK